MKALHIAHPTHYYVETYPKLLLAFYVEDEKQKLKN